MVILSRNITGRSTIAQEEQFVVKLFTYLTCLIPTALCWWVGILSSFDLNLDNSLNHSVMNDLLVAGATYFVSGFVMALFHSAVVAKHTLAKVAASGCVFLFLINAVLFSLWRILFSFVPTEYHWPSLAVPAILTVILVATAAKWRVRNRIHVIPSFNKTTTAGAAQARFRNR